MESNARDIIDVLLDKKLLDKKQAEEVRSDSKKLEITLEEAVLNKNLLGEDILLQVKSELTGFPAKDLLGQKISEEILKEIPEDAVQYYKFVPLAKTGSVLEVGMVDPNDLKAREALRFISLRKKLQIAISLIKLSDFREVLKQYRPFRGEVKKALEQLKEEKADKKVKEDLLGEEDREEVADAPITKIVAVILKHAQEGGASDIHIEPAENKTKVRFRVDGVLHIGLLLPNSIHSAILTRIKILSHLQIDETRVPQDGRFHAVISGKKIDFRVSTFPTTYGEKAVLRLLDASVGVRNFVELGIEGHNLEMLEMALSKTAGMVLMTGPTGSGKTTTLYSILHKLNQEGVNVVSLEDPVEYFIEGVAQSQIKPEIGYTFASGLRHILRQDPDIIMVGEIRDDETASLATHAALTGHLVLSTLHTNDSLGVIPRLIDMGVGKFLLPPTINLAMAQRLVRKLCDHCKKPVDPQPELLKVIEKEMQSLPEDYKRSVDMSNVKVYRGEGCKYCAKKGTKGRVGVFESILMTPELEKIILEAPSESAIRQEGIRQGMITMKQDGVLKAIRGIVGLEEVLKAVEV